MLVSIMTFWVPLAFAAFWCALIGAAYAAHHYTKVISGLHRTIDSQREQIALLQRPDDDDDDMFVIRYPLDGSAPPKKDGVESQ